MTSRQLPPRCFKRVNAASICQRICPVMGVGGWGYFGAMGQKSREAMWTNVSIPPSAAGHPLTFTHQTRVCSQRSQQSEAPGPCLEKKKKTKAVFPTADQTGNNRGGKREQMRCRREVSDHSDRFSFRPKSRILSSSQRKSSYYWSL